MVAVALSIAVHEVLAGFVRAPGAPEPDRETVRRATIARIETPHPSPTPKPSPTPPPRAPFAPVHAAPAAAAAAPHVAIRRQAAATIHRALAPQSTTPAVAGSPDAVAMSPAQSAGDGTSGATGAIGAGSGAGTSAAAGGGGGDEPCGAVDFLGHGSHYDAAVRGFLVAVRLVVHFPDGHAESLALDYPFFYPSAAENPFSEQNRDNPGVPVVLQTPPPELAAGEPALLQYVVKHTAAEGFTLLARCPATASAP